MVGKVEDVYPVDYPTSVPTCKENRDNSKSQSVNKKIGRSKGGVLRKKTGTGRILPFGVPMVRGRLRSHTPGSLRWSL